MASPVQRFSIAPVTLNGSAITVQSISLTELQGGMPLVTSTGICNYLTDPYTPPGESITVNGVTEVAPGRPRSPWGAMGPLVSETYYAQDGTTAIGTLTESHSVEINNSTSVKHGVDAVGTVDGVVSSQTGIYTVGTSGGVSLIEVDILVDGQMIQFKAS